MRNVGVQVQCEAVEVFEDLPPVTSLPLDWIVVVAMQDNF